MNDALLPIELCENIIDQHACVIADEWDRQPAFQENYDALRACSLVCSAWLPRSRRILLHDVGLDSFDRVDLLFRIITDKPRLAKLVTAIYLVGSKYIPFARFALPPLFPNCHRLIMAFPDWNNIYPPGYSKYISGFQDLRELELRVDGLSAPELFHIIWSLPLLSSLTLSCLHGRSRIARFGGNFGEKFMAKHAQMRCRELKCLSFISETLLLDRTFLRIENFPPRGCFGDSVTHLNLSISDSYMNVSTSFLECISDFMQLHSITIKVDLFLAGPSHDQAHVSFGQILKIFQHLQSGQRLRQIRISYLAGHLIENGTGRHMYGITRHGFLDMLCSAQVQSALQRFPCLELFHLTVEENVNGHTALWWTEQIVNRLPALRSVIQVGVKVCLSDDATRCPYLWDPERLAEFRRA